MKKIGILAACFSATAVMLGAFGAHGLKDLIDAHGLEIWNKGVQYQFYHTFALLFVYVLMSIENAKVLRNAAIGFSLGILLFSGSLYLLACRDIMGLSDTFVKIIGPITPLGGMSFIVGWIFVLISFIKAKK